MFKKQMGRNVEAYVNDILVRSKKVGSHLDEVRLKLKAKKCKFVITTIDFLGYLVT